MTTSTWHWIVCLAVPFATILEAALPHSFGTFVAYFQTSTDLKFAVLAWITATTSAIPCICLPIFVKFVKRYNQYYRYFGLLSFFTMSCSCFISSTLTHIEWMFLTYTLIYGLSSALLLAVCIIILSDYFPVSHPHHILASSLYQIGYPVAASCFSPLMAFLITNVKWNHALQILGGIQLVFGCSTALLFKPRVIDNYEAGDLELNPSSNESEVNDENQPLSSNESSPLCHRSLETLVCCKWDDIRQRPQMYTWFIAKFLNYICWFSMRTNLTPFLHWRGHSLTKASFIMTTYAMGEIGLCILAALISPFLRGKLLLVHIIGSAGMAVLMLSWSSLPSVYGLELLVAILIGIFVQTTLTFGYPASVEVLGLDMSLSWTVTNVFAGMGILASPVLGGVTFDATSSFMLFFYVAGALWVLQLILHNITALLLRFQNR